MGIGTHPPVALRRQLGQFRHKAPFLVEQFFGLVAFHPAFELLDIIGMAGIGTALNRFGNPTASGGKGTNLTWTTLATVKADTTGNACNLASALLNFFDGANSAIQYLASGTVGNIKSVLTLLESPIQTYATTTQCHTVDGFTQAQCDAAYTRLRYRGACQEQDAAASVAAGVIVEINLLWQ